MLFSCELYSHEVLKPIVKFSHMIPGLRASAWHNPHTFPWCRLLEANAHIIRAELLNVVAAQRREQRQEGWEAVGAHQRAEFGTDRTLVTDGGSWREFVLMGVGVMSKRFWGDF